MLKGSSDGWSIGRSLPTPTFINLHIKLYFFSMPASLHYLHLAHTLRAAARRRFKCSIHCLQFLARKRTLGKNYAVRLTISMEKGPRERSKHHDIKRMARPDRSASPSSAIVSCPYWEFKFDGHQLAVRAARIE